MKKIGFVILTYNSAGYIENCLKSLNSIKKFDVKIYVADNGSIDDTVKIIESLDIKNLNLLKLDKNYGTTISRNKCLHLIKDVDYICVLDSDTVVNEDAFIKMVDYLDNNSGIGIVGPSMVGLDGAKQIPYRKFPTWKIKLCKICPIAAIRQYGESLEKYEIKDNLQPIECDYLISACWLMKYDTYKVIGDLDEKIFYSPEDVEYCMRVRSNHLNIVHIPTAQIIHIYQRISRKKLFSKANYTHILGINYTLRKHKKFLKKYRKGEFYNENIVC